VRLNGRVVTPVLDPCLLREIQGGQGRNLHASYIEIIGPRSREFPLRTDPRESPALFLKDLTPVGSRPPYSAKIQRRPPAVLTRLIPEVCSSCADLMADGFCQRFGYGGSAGMAAVEAIFTSDSPAATDILALIRTTPELDHLTATIVSIDDLLASAG
jgi:hypothetical protein